MSMSCARNSSSKALFLSFRFSRVKNMRCIFMSSPSVYFFWGIPTFVKNTATPVCVSACLAFKASQTSLADFFFEARIFRRLDFCHNHPYGLIITVACVIVIPCSIGEISRSCKLFGSTCVCQQWHGSWFFRGNRLITCAKMPDSETLEFGCHSGCPGMIVAMRELREVVRG